MQTSSKDQNEWITKTEALKILDGRFTSRQLTEFYREGLLPPLQRTSHPSNNKPVYMWDISVIEQAQFLYDLLQWNKNHRWVLLPLWLCGYPVDFSPIQQRWLQSLDAYLQAFTCGNSEVTYPGDGPEDHVSRAIDQLKGRWKHTPTPYRSEPLQKLGLEAYAQLSEIFWDVLLVAKYEVDETTLADVLAMGQRMNAPTNMVPPQEDFIEGGQGFRPLALNTHLKRDCRPPHSRPIEQTHKKPSLRTQGH